MVAGAEHDYTCAPGAEGAGIKLETMTVNHLGFAELTVYGYPCPRGGIRKYDSATGLYSTLPGSALDIGAGSDDVVYHITNAERAPAQGGKI